MTKFNQPLGRNSHGKVIRTVEDLRADGSNCEECACDPCYRYETVANWNSENGTYEVLARYYVDGTVKLDTIANAKAEIQGYKDLGGVAATSVAISGCPEANLDATDTAQLTATVSPNGSNQAGVWTTSDAGVATVDNTGLVTAVATGTATITFTSTDGDFTDTCVVTVN